MNTAGTVYGTLGPAFASASRSSWVQDESMTPGGGSVTEKNRSSALRAAAEKRKELKQAVSDVETAIASASADPAWRVRLIVRLEELSGALLRHVEEVEAPNGLLDELTSIAPRLVNKIQHVRDEHPILCTRTSVAIGAVKEGAAVDLIRADVLGLLSAIATHRQAGADLVYEGYEVDIGGGG